jgi:hypothetical protein
VKKPMIIEVINKKEPMLEVDDNDSKEVVIVINVEEE